MNDNLENENQKKNASTIKLKEVSVELKTIRKTENEIVETSEVFNEELELLKAKCNHYETALKKVLFYIIPDPCRYVVDNALLKGKTEFNKK
jgi:hypothetical protein